TVAAALDQHVEDLAFVVDGTPDVHSVAGIRTTISSRCQRSLGRGRRPRSRRAITGQLQHPAPDGFVGDVEPSLGEEIFDVSVAEREAQVEPDRMLDDDGRKPVTTV